MEEAKKEDSKKSNIQAEGFLRSVISGSLFGEKLVLRNLGFLGMLTVIGALYIANRFHAEKIVRQTDALQEQLKELKAESMATSADLMYLSKQSEVYRLVRQNELGLKELKEPPYKLTVKR